MFHHFPEDDAFRKNYLVQSLDFKYLLPSINQSGQAKVTYLKTIKQIGYIRKREEENTAPNLRWIANGRTVLNNKGNPVKQYEPYFSFTPQDEDAKEWVETGVHPFCIMMR